MKIFSCITGLEPSLSLLLQPMNLPTLTFRLGCKLMYCSVDFDYYTLDFVRCVGLPFLTPILKYHGLTIKAALLQIELPLLSVLLYLSLAHIPLPSFSHCRSGSPLPLLFNKNRYARLLELTIRAPNSFDSICYYEILKY